jgi:predicted TIM-barrel fold metal-dependent hydrolase
VAKPVQATGSKIPRMATFAAIDLETAREDRNSACAAAENFAVLSERRLTSGGPAMFIDCDSHIDECVETWSYFPKSKIDLRPAEMTFDPGQEPGYLAARPSRGVFIDGELYRHILRRDDTTGTTMKTRELRDIPLRLKHMDDLGVDSQVIYPTTLLTEVTKRAEVEVPLCESYNRWLADRCSDSGGRLRWACVLPVRSIDDALKELRRAKDDGAVAIFKRGYECDERRASDPYFHPIYELAEELDIPICMHIARPNTGVHSALSKTRPGLFSAAYNIDAFLGLLMDGVTEKFSKLRFGMVESAAGWLPYALWLSSFDKLFSNEPGKRAALRGSYAKVLEDERIFVTCESTEDLPTLIASVGDNCLCVGSDYGHSDRAAIMQAHSNIMERTDIDKASAEKITSDNGRALYGIS